MMGVAYPPHRLAMGRGTIRRMVEGFSTLQFPSVSCCATATSLSQVDGEDKL
jgi:hypothetical protein